MNTGPARTSHCGAGPGPGCSTLPATLNQRRHDGVLPTVAIEGTGGVSYRKTTVTVLAGLVVFLALVTPDNVSRLPEGSSPFEAFLRIPVEGFAGIAVLLALPHRARRPAAAVLGALLGLLTVIKVIDMGFYATLARQFDPVLDWPLFADGYRFVKDSFGRPAAIGAVAGAILLAVAVVLLTTLSVVRLTAVAARHRVAAARSTAAASCRASTSRPPRRRNWRTTPR